MAGRAAKRVRAVRKVTVSFMGAGVHFSGELVNLSTTGVLVRCSENLEEGTVGRLGIELDQQTIRIVAVVRRHVPGVGLALEFSNMQPRDREMLYRLLSRLELWALHAKPSG